MVRNIAHKFRFLTSVAAPGRPLGSKDADIFSIPLILCLFCSLYAFRQDTPPRTRTRATNPESGSYNVLSPLRSTQLGGSTPTETLTVEKWRARSAANKVHGKFLKFFSCIKNERDSFFDISEKEKHENKV